MITTIKSVFCKVMKDESGLSAVEYGLLAAGIAIGLWTLIDSIGTNLNSIFTSVDTDISAAAPAAGG
jgi:pilus assembly protein Flp/PilA